MSVNGVKFSRAWGGSPPQQLLTLSQRIVPLCMEKAPNVSNRKYLTNFFVIQMFVCNNAAQGLGNICEESAAKKNNVLAKQIV